MSKNPIAQPKNPILWPFSLFWLYLFWLPIGLTPTLTGVEPGSEKRTDALNQSVLSGNKLNIELNPYLLQHSQNPIHWFPWSEEPFEKAKGEKKLIFLSIGYSSCHWCHVMEKESFQEPKIAEFLNKNFVSIKVDREARPDLDRIYMDYILKTTGGGGWPMTLILSPEKIPLFGGTYFAPTSKWGRPGLMDILERMSYLNSKQPEKILRVEEEIKKFYSLPPEELAPQISLGSRFIESFPQRLQPNLDLDQGGLLKAPKFPQEPLLFHTLLMYYDQKEIADWVDNSLYSLILKGLFDPIDGGLFRYSVDSKWQIPHFEKMLYNQGGFLSILALHYHLKKDPLVKFAIGKTLDFLLNNFKDPLGGFYTSLDADSNGREGAYYLWDQKEIDGIIGLSTPFKNFYRLNQKPNFEGVEHHLTSGNQNNPVPLLNNEFFFTDIALLKKIRDQRTPPFLDKKIILGWNGLTLTSLARVLKWVGNEDPDLKLKVEKTGGDLIEFLNQKMLLKGGGFSRYQFQNTPVGEAFLSDYSYFLEGVLEWYEATYEEKFLDQAKNLGKKILKKFFNLEKNLVSFSASKGEIIPPHLLVPLNFQDGALPAETSILCHSLLKLAAYTSDESFYKMAELLIKKYLAKNQGHPPSIFQSSWLPPLALYHLKPVKIALFGAVNLPEYHQLKSQLLTFIKQNNKIRLFYISKPQGDPLFNRVVSPGAEPAIVICEGETCLLPVRTFKEALSHLSPRILKFFPDSKK